jgi:hypothetical protein
MKTTKWHSMRLKSLSLIAAPLLMVSVSATQAGADNSALADSKPLVIQIESVVMGTDGQMRVRVNGQYLTRHSERDGIRVLDMNYDQVQVQAQGQVFWMKPHHTLTLEDLTPR